MEGTVISDAVNVASRIEGMTKMYGVSLLISDETFSNLDSPSKYHIRKIDRVKAKGKAEPTTIWEVFDGDPPDILKYKLSIGMIFKDAISLYHSKRFEEAQELFLDCLARNPNDKTAQVYRDRCKLYIKMGADENMEGIVRRVTYERGL
jgi:two-component system sensor histidine kinase ChiS